MMLRWRNGLFAFRLAWRQLTAHKTRLFTASLGVAFACFLVFMQFGFRDSLYTSARLLPQSLNGDLFILHKQTEAIWRSAYFSRLELARALGLREVEVAVPLYLGFAQFKNPQTMIKRTIMLWAYDPAYPALLLPELMHQQQMLSQDLAASFDEHSRPEFGDILGHLAAGKHAVEVNDTRIEIWDTFKFGASFSAEGNVVTNVWTFLKIFPYRNSSQVDIGVIKVAEGADVLRVQNDLQRLLSPNVMVLTKDELTQMEMDYWENSAPIGFVFGLGAVMGLVVGMVLTYQVLFTDIANNIREYATLRAMGYKFSYLALFVVATAIYLAVIGFFPGLLLSYVLYTVSESVIYIPMPMPLSKILLVFSYILAMCVASGLLAMSKLRSTSPADMF